MDEFTDNSESIKSYQCIKMTEPSDWECYLFGGDTLKWVPSKGKEPNWFWRKMQYLLFGNMWAKREKNT